MSGYNDILHLPHPVSPRRAHMSRLDRAAQFAPFAALTGYDESIQETARVTQEFRELEEGQIAQIDEALRFLQTQDHPEVTVTYFQPDPKKPGGHLRHRHRHPEKNRPPPPAPPPDPRPHHPPLPNLRNPNRGWI